MSSSYTLNNYEITLILNPNSKEDDLHTFLKNTLPEGGFSVESLGRRELAYKIKGKSSAYYFVVDVLSDADGIKDFQRRATFSKEILRFLVINTDKERGLSRDFPINFKARQIAKILRKEEEQELAERLEETVEGELEGKEREENTFQEASSFEEEESLTEEQEETIDREELEEKVRFSEIFEEQLDIQGKQFTTEEEDGKFDIQALFVSMGFNAEDIPEDIEEQIERLRENERISNLKVETEENLTEEVNP